MSNTSIGRGEKGSKFWIQTLVTIGQEYLLNEIKHQLPQITAIKWESPKVSERYKELEAKNINQIKGANLSFWPPRGPVWDAVGIANDGTVLLVEAKAHPKETETECRATAQKSKDLIKESIMATHQALAMKGHKYQESVWYSDFYQLANRLAFLYNLTSQNFNVKLVLLNIVDDPTYIKTSQDEWERHYDDVFQKMLGTSTLPNNVILLDLDVG